MVGGLRVIGGAATFADDEGASKAAGESGGSAVGENLGEDRGGFGGLGGFGVGLRGWVGRG